MTKLNLSVAMGDYDRTRPIHDGRVQIDGVEPITMLQPPEEMFFRAFRHQVADVTELSLSSYVISLTRPDPAYVGVPVFLSRAFRHTSVYVRADRGIDRPEDLKGRRIGLAEYQLTANVWVRAILGDYGVGPGDVTWVRGGMHSAGRPEKLKVQLPQGVVVEEAPAGTTLNALLADGAIDGFIGPRSPRVFEEGHPQVVRLWRDSIAAAEEWYGRTKIFPIMHILGVRASLVRDHPWLPGALMKAFEAARTMALEQLEDTSATKVTMPFVEDTLARSRAMSRNLWSYGLAGNEHILDAFLDAHNAQGLSPRRVGIEELFAPSTVESFSI